MFVACLRVEWKPIADRYNGGIIGKVVPISACEDVVALENHGIPDPIARELVAIAQLDVAFSATAFLVGDWAVKVSIVSNTLPGR